MAARVYEVVVTLHESLMHPPNFHTMATFQRFHCWVFACARRRNTGGVIFVKVDDQPPEGVLGMILFKEKFPKD